MLTIFNGSDGYPISQDDYYIRELASGYDEVIFNVDIRDPIYQYVREEAIVRDRDQNEYIIKQIDAGNSSAKVIAQINLDAWKSQLFMNYSNNSDTVAHTVSGVLPSGWMVQDYSGITKRRTIPTGDETTDYNVTALEVLEACTSVYEVRFRFDVRNKKVSIINPKNFLSSGAFATRDLNLKALNYKGKSDALITRLYAEGADGLTFADINDGKPYVENRTYVDKIIVGFWKDDRYTNKESLLEDAQAKVDELSRPEQSYNCDVLDLANTNPEMYGFEDFSLFEVVTLIDDAKEVRADYQVVERWTYPYYPVNNKVILSESTPSILSTIQTVVASINSPISGFQQMMQAAIANATSLITGNKGGYVVFHDSDDDGCPDEILIMNTPDISTATKVWRWNASGLGYSDHGYDPQSPYGYGLAMTIDGSIVANFITTGQLNAGLIKVGTIQDFANKNYWNMETGEFRLSAGAQIGGSDIASVDEVDDAIEDYDTNYLNQTRVFNKLTNNGLLKGIYMSNGELYINGTYIKTGVLDADLIKAGIIKDSNNKNYWNMQTGEFKLSATTAVGNSTVASTADVEAGDSDTLDAANSAADTKISNYNTSLDQSAVFNKLTNNGTIQGIYMDNGQLYVNGAYMKAQSIEASALTVNATNTIISSTVKKDSVISSINQSAEQVSISASKIDLSGDLDLHGTFTTDKTTSQSYQGYYAKMDACRLRFFDANDQVQTGFELMSSSGVNFIGLTIEHPTGATNGVFLGPVRCELPALIVENDSIFGLNSSLTSTATFWSEVTFKRAVYDLSGGLLHTSDRRKKRSIKDLVIEKAKSFIMGLKPRKFKYSKDLSTSGRYHHGFIAQEVKEAMSEDWGVYVENKEKDFIGLRYDELLADMVAVMQDQEKRIDALERRMNDLTNDQS